MKKTLLLIAIIFLQISCSSNDVHDKWVGESKQKLIKSWGPPVRILHDDENNDIFLYADQIFTTNHSREVSGDAGPSYWKYDYMYINKSGKIISWKNEKQKFPPQSVDAKTIGMASKK
ncbi:hypothetical protein HNP37_004220 [Flavobacterium nitrogenifigens]|uniref:Uncharacterized protein n=2 Tax=Flavobacterium TaxID=237 RepID=A0A7W7J0S1_9FLAO|nr:MULTISPECIES: hypothetical protein [Flavobacterium]MBB4804134.1 hypothetical protein [Flavobacterium nitrogenifigens]MBB6389093.1 hypothetical protein [Flavobacterium notoginsengisoli]